MKLLTLAALAVSVWAQEPAATVTRVNIGQLKQLGIVTNPNSLDHFQVIVRVYKPNIRSIDVTLNISIDGQAAKVAQLAYVTEYSLNGDKLCGAVLQFEVPDISRAVVVGEPVIIENPKVEASKP